MDGRRLMIPCSTCYLLGVVTCFFVICFDVGMAPDDVTPPSIFEVSVMAALWPLVMPLLAYVQWIEEKGKGRGKQS